MITKAPADEDYRPIKPYSFTCDGRIMASRELGDREKIMLNLLVSFTQNTGVIYDTSSITYALRLGWPYRKEDYKSKAVLDVLHRLEGLGYISTKAMVVDGKSKLHIQVNKLKVNEDFGWHIFPEAKPTNGTSNIISCYGEGGKEGFPPLNPLPFPTRSETVGDVSRAVEDINNIIPTTDRSCTPSYGGTMDIRNFPSVDGHNPPTTNKSGGQKNTREDLENPKNICILSTNNPDSPAAFLERAIIRRREKEEADKCKGN